MVTADHLFMFDHIQTMSCISPTHPPPQTARRLTVLVIATIACQSMHAFNHHHITMTRHHLAEPAEVLTVKSLPEL